MMFDLTAVHPSLNGSVTFFVHLHISKEDKLILEKLDLLEYELEDKQYSLSYLSHTFEQECWENINVKKLCAEQIQNYLLALANS